MALHDLLSHDGQLLILQEPLHVAVLLCHEEANANRLPNGYRLDRLQLTYARWLQQLVPEPCYLLPADHELNSPAYHRLA